MAWRSIIRFLEEANYLPQQHGQGDVIPFFHHYTYVESDSRLSMQNDPLDEMLSILSYKMRSRIGTGPQYISIPARWVVLILIIC